MNRIGIVYQSKKPAAEPVAAEIGSWLAERGIESWISSTWDEDNANGNMGDTSLLIVLGGDGSILHAARLAISHSVPIFGINMGRVGFLSEAQPHDWPERLGKVLTGDYWVENRLMLHAALMRNGHFLQEFTALNDMVVGRGRDVRILNMELRVDDDLVTTYHADALIVATPTGSTAYSMAAGGPMLPPRLMNFVVTPVAAHLSLNRSLIFHEEAEISIKVQMDHEAMLTADGQDSISLQDDDTILIKKHANYCCFARVESSGYFYRRLMRRLGFSRKM